MNKKVIVITGSTRGIGLGMAKKFLDENYCVVFNGRNSETLKKCMSEFRKNGDEVLGVAGDVSLEETSKNIADAALKEYGRIDIWINNAGIPQPYSSFSDLKYGEMKDVLDVNIIGTILGTKTAVNVFKKQGFGKVFNMEGLGSDGRIVEKLAVYGTSKRAIRYFTRAVSKELKGLPVQMGLLSPGMVKTEFIEISGNLLDEVEKARMQKVTNILAHDVEEVTSFLVKKILVSKKNFDTIRFLTFPRLFPKLIKIMFVK